MRRTWKQVLPAVIFCIEIFLAQFRTFAQDSWEPTNGPWGGQVTCIARTPDGLLFAGTLRGIYQSSNEGESWQLSDFGTPQSTAAIAGPQCLVAHPSGDVFAGYRNYGVLRSGNGGRTWISVNNGIGSWSGDGIHVDVYALAVGPAGTILAGTSRGLARSTDNGENWQFGVRNIEVWSIAFDSSGHVFAGTYFGGAFVSSDDGRSWTRISTAPANVLYRVLAVSPHGALFAGTSDGMFRTTDFGGIWTAQNAGLQKIDIQCITFLHQQSVLAGAFPSGLYLSTNEGETWDRRGTTVSSVVPLTLITSGSSTIYMGAIDGLFLSSDDGVSWAWAGDGINNSFVSSLAVDNDGSLIACTGGGRFARSTNSGATWVLVGSMGTNVVNLAPSQNGVLFGSGWGGNFRSIDHGVTWSPANVGLTDTSVLSIVIRPDGSLLVGTYRGGIFRSSNNGVAWTASGLAGYEVRGLALNSRGDVFAATNAGVFLSLDGGNSWSQTGNHQYTWLVAVSPADEVFAGYGNTVSRSTNNGATWEEPGYLGNIFAASLLSDRGGDLFGCGSGGVVRGTEGSSCWKFVNDGLPVQLATSAVIGRDGHLYVGIFNSGVFRTKEPVVHRAGNVVRNSQFASGPQGWSFYTNGEGTFTVAAEPPWTNACHAGRVTVQTEGSNTQLYQKDIPLQAGRRYRLSFSAFCGSGHSVGVDILKDKTPYTQYGLDGWDFQLSNFWRRYSVDFTASGFAGRVNDARLRFRFNSLAASGDIYYLDDVYLQQVEDTGKPRIVTQPNAEIAPVGAGARFSVDVTGGLPLLYQWLKNDAEIPGASDAVYTTPPVQLSDEGSLFRCRVTNAFGTVLSERATLSVTAGAPSLVSNADFEAGTQPWFFYSDAADGGTFATDIPGVGNGQAGHVAINKQGTNVQLFQSAIRLEAGMRYRLSFKAYSSGGLDMEVSIHQHGTPFASYGLDARYLNLETYWKTFVFEFGTDNLSATVMDGRVKFWFAPYAEKGTQYFLDNVLLEKLGPLTAKLTSSDGAVSGIPGDYALGQSFPNPANPSATIRYALPTAVHVRIIVYDLLGQEVVTLVDEMQSPGYHQVAFGGAAQASGVYLYKLSAPSFVATRKLILLR